MIRRWRTDDLPDLAALDAELFGIDAWDREAWADLLVGPGRRAWVADGPGSRVEGYALCGTVGEVTDLLRIGVHPRVRRQGLASDLLARVLDASREDGADRVLLEVGETNDGAVRFYAQHGFQRIDRRARYYRDGSAALVLSLVLARAPGATGEVSSERMDP